MKHALKATLVATMLLGGVATAAQAQTANNSGTGNTAPGATSGNNTPSLGASSQANPPRSDSAAPAAVTTTTDPSRTNQAPVAGANSFTEAQARARIQDKGFGEVKDLKRDDKGVWRGTAMKDGKSVAVALDYQGNIVGQ